MDYDENKIMNLKNSKTPENKDNLGNEENSDDELANLEFEESYNSNNSDEEVEKAKLPEKSEKNLMPQVYIKKESSPIFTPQEYKDPQQENQKFEKDKISQEKKDDLYPERVENKYHSVDKMNSLGVLEKEKELCDIIIIDKKNIGKDYDLWEDKKDSIKEQNRQKVTGKVSAHQCGRLNFGKYHSEIQINVNKYIILLIQTLY